MTKRWSLKTKDDALKDCICECGLPHTNRSIVTVLNAYDRDVKELTKENEQLKNKKSKFKKSFIQRCCFFIGCSITIISMPFWLITDPLWCQDLGFVLTMVALVIVIVTWIHCIIFGGLYD